MKMALKMKANLLLTLLRRRTAIETNCARSSDNELVFSDGDRQTPVSFLTDLHTVETDSSCYCPY